MKLFVKRINPEIELPHYATETSSGMDFYSPETFTLAPGETKKIQTGIAVQPENPDWCMLILPRSGLGSKHGIVLRNTIGLVDSDYTGEIFIPLINTSEKAFTLNKGDRFAQGMMIMSPQFETTEVVELDKTIRDSGGFGSTGV